MYVVQNALVLNRAALCNQAMTENDGDVGEAERNRIRALAAQKLGELFDILRIDHRNDHNTRDTPQRVAKMYL